MSGLLSITEKVWIRKGLQCRVIFVRQSHRCGYVCLPITHPDYNKEDIEVMVHGGITYASKEEDDRFWVGFDCAHLGDRFLELSRVGFGIGNQGHFWTLEEVIAETDKLADQLADRMRNTYQEKAKMR